MKYGKECVCGRGGECQGVSAAFALLKDPRRAYVMLPQYTPEPKTHAERDMNAMRASYLRHLRRTEQSLGDSQERRYVALHHFHPVVVQKHSELPNAISPIPKTLKKVDLRFLGMDLGDQDRIRDESGKKRKQYYFVPNWPIDQAKEDLKYLIRVSRLFEEARQLSSTQRAITPSPKYATQVIENQQLLEHESAYNTMRVHQTNSSDIKRAEPPTLSDNQQKSKLPLGRKKEKNEKITRIQDLSQVSNSYTSSDQKISVDSEAKQHTSRALLMEFEKIEPESQASPLDDVKGKESKNVSTDIVGDLNSPGTNSIVFNDSDNRFSLPAKPMSERIFSTEFSTATLPKNMSSESEEGRKYVFHQISHFESRRQAICTPLVEEFVLRWTSSLKIMQSGIFEMARAERLIRGAALASKAYAEVMQANYEDAYLDLEGKTIHEKRKQSLFTVERKILETTYDSIAGSPEKSRNSYAKGSVLSSVVESQDLIATKFSENYESVNESVVSELANLRTILKKKMIEFKRRGDPFIRDIQGSETEINTTFAVFDIIGPNPRDALGNNASNAVTLQVSLSGASPVHAAGSFHGNPLRHSSHHDNTEEESRRLFGRKRLDAENEQEAMKALDSDVVDQSLNNDSEFTYASAVEENPPAGLSQTLLNHSTSPIAALLRNSAIVKDGWLLEMFYRQAVNAQIQIIQKCGAALEEIWKSMHEVEVNRRLRLKEVMLDFLPRQRRLYLGLSPIPAPVLLDLVQLRSDPQELRDQLEDDIRKQMESLLKLDNFKRSHIMNRSRAQAPNLEEMHGVLSGDYFDNGLMRAAAVVERKIHGVLTSWKTTLIVVTSDNHLHLFDLSFLPDVVVGSPAESVFELLLPDYVIPSFDSHYVERRIDPLLKDLIPIDSVDLTKCSFSVFENKITVEIQESGTMGIIAFESNRKILLRLVSHLESQRLMEILDAQSKSNSSHKEGTLSREAGYEEEFDLQKALRIAEVHAQSLVDSQQDISC